MKLLLSFLFFSLFISSSSLAILEQQTLKDPLQTAKTSYVSMADDGVKGENNTCCMHKSVQSLKI